MTYSSDYFWSITLGLAVILYLLRAAFILFQDRIHYSQTVKELLDFVAPAALAALAVPSLIFTANTGYSVNWPQILAGLAAIAVVLKTKNIALTIAVGIAVLWLFRLV
ncbi:MAG: AzlD domain-containing protein [Desulfovibrionales bacterium]|nr:AzlD domain-containing protein [Desulfovibrionales bacterium]